MGWGTQSGVPRVGLWSRNPLQSLRAAPPSLGRALRRGVGTPAPCLCQQVTDSPRAGDGAHAPPEAVSTQPGDAAWRASEGLCQSRPQSGACPPTCGSSGFLARAGAGPGAEQPPPTCALACPARPKFPGEVMQCPGPPRHVAPVPQLRWASSPSPGSRASLGIIHRSVEGTAGPTLPIAPSPGCWWPGLGTRQGRGWVGVPTVPVCQPCRCARRSCCRCHLHTTDSSCSSGAEL